MPHIIGGNCFNMEMIEKGINEQLNNEIEASEATTSNIYKRLTDENTCAIISPYRSEYSDNENKFRMNSLKLKVREMGYGFNQFISRWVEGGQAFDEQSLLIPNITKDRALSLGKEFEQSSIIFKDSESCREICINPFEDYKPGQVVRIFFNTGNHILNIDEAKEIFARRKGGPPSIPVKGSNKQPFSPHQKKAFELYEVEQPRASYFQRKETKRKIF